MDEYRYFGRLLTLENELSKEHDRRITAGWKRFGEYKNLNDENILLRFKTKIKDTVILPAKTYGLERWTHQTPREQADRDPAQLVKNNAEHNHER